MQLEQVLHLFGLDEETERRLTHMRSLHLNKEDRYRGLAKIYCLVSKKVIYKRCTVPNGEPE